MGFLFFQLKKTESAHFCITYTLELQSQGGGGGGYSGILVTEMCE